MQKLWEKDDVDSEDEVFENFKNDIKFDGERYVTKLPVKRFHRELPDNYYLSKCRLIKLKQRLDKDVELKRNYDDVIKQYERDGIIERVENPGTPGKTHYIPHHPVIKAERETTKLRIVFDGSAKIQGKPSLNECLYSGPSLHNLILD